MNTVTSIKSLFPVHSDVTTSTSDAPQALPDPSAYGRDLWERSVLFVDTLRERTAILAVEGAIGRARITCGATYERRFRTLYGNEKLDAGSNPHMPV